MCCECKIEMVTRNKRMTDQRAKVYLNFLKASGCFIEPKTVLYRDDYNSLTSDIFQVVLLNVRPLILYLSSTMYGCPIK